MSTEPREPSPCPWGETESAALLEALEEGVLVTEGGRVGWSNAALARMLGAPASELRGRDVAELLADEQGRPSGPARACRVRNARGELLPVELRAAGARTWLVRDRTRERRLETEVFRLARGLGAANPPPGAGLPGPEFLGTIEHEIRTATTVIHGYTRMLQDGRVGALNATQAEFLRETRRASERISSLLDNLLELSSLEGSPHLRVVRKPIHLHAVIRAASDAVRPLVDERAQALELDLEAETDGLRGDAERLEQVFVNLLSNAVKFSPEGSELRVRTETRAGGGAVEVQVIDSGPGVAREEAERIFLPFVQGSAAEFARRSGVGLGLAICRRILDAHGGTIEAVPGLGRGLFRLQLPMAATGEEGRE
jgi:signal transduction histidine kinase